MNLFGFDISRFSDKLFGRQQLPSPALSRSDLEKAQSDVVQPNAPGFQRKVFPGQELVEKMHISQNRYEVLRDVRMMVKNDVRASRILHKLSSDAAHGGFEVIVEDGPGKRAIMRAQEIINRVRYKIQDERHMRGWLEGMLRDGDLFLQILVEQETMEIGRVKKLAAEMTYSRLNPEGDFPADQSPYYQAHPYDLQNELRSFQEWEITQGKWRPEDGMPYGTSIFAAARLVYQRVDAGEKNVTIRRQKSAGSTRLHNIGSEDNPGTWDDVDKYKEQNQDSLDNPQRPFNDLYSNGLVSIEDFQGDTQLDQLEDLRYFEGLLNMAGFASQASMSGGRETASNREVIDSQDFDYDNTLEQVCEAIVPSLKYIYDLELLLKGVNPESINYRFNWRSKNRHALDKKLLRAGLGVELGFSHQTAYEIADLDNNVSYEEELDRIKKQKEQGIVPYAGPTISRGYSSAKKDKENDDRLGDTNQ